MAACLASNAAGYSGTNTMPLISLMVLVAPAAAAKEINVLATGV